MKAGKLAIPPWLSCPYNEHMLMDLPSSMFSGLKLRRATITIKSRVLMRVYNSEINVLPKGHSTEASKILLIIDNLKRPAPETM